MSWTQQEKLTATGAMMGDNFGRSVSISGNAALIGAPDDPLSTGQAYEFELFEPVAEPLISNVTPSDGTGRTYFSDGSPNGANSGAIKYVDSSDDSNVVFRPAGDPGSDPVWARGLAGRDDEPDVVYFLDGNNNTVRRAPRFGAVDDSWGNTTLGPFNDPAGARFDTNGNLYVTTATALYRIAPDETVTLVTGGFTGAAGIDLSEDTGIPMLLVVDEATGEVFLVDGEDGGKELVGNGFTSPVAVVFSEANGELFYDVAEATRIIRLPDPRVKFTLRDRTHVLMHKYRTDDSFPSSFQTEDGNITIEATVIDKTPVAGVTVYFQVIDPKDNARYAATGTNDNKGGPGMLSVPSAVSDSQGKVQVVLTVTDTFSGDNYQIEASLRAPPNFKKVARTPMITAWRRAYVEYDRMYKDGEFLYQPSGAGQPVGMPDATKVFVVNPNTFTVGDVVHVFSGFTGFAGGGTQATLTGEMRQVAAVVTTPPPAHIVVEAIPPSTIDALQHTYPYSGGAPPGEDPPYSFVAKVGAGVYDIGVTKEKLAPVFDDAFVDWVFVDVPRHIPYWNIAEVNQVGRSAFFFDNREPPSFSLPKTNHVQLVAAGTHMDPVFPDAVGSTLENFNLSWVFFDKLVAACNAAVLANCVLSTTAHELVHQWDVNSTTNLGGHDLQLAHNSLTRGCLMNLSSDDRLPDLAKLHDNLTAPPSPSSIDLYCLRGHVDDLNQTACSWPPFFP